MASNTIGLVIPVYVYGVVYRKKTIGTSTNRRIYSIVSVLVGCCDGSVP